MTVIYLGIIAAFLYLWLSKKSYEAGRVNRDAAMRMSTLVAEMLAALKEITLRDKAQEVGNIVLHSRERAARSRSNIRFMSAVPKFVIDMALIGGFLLIGAVGFMIGGMEAAMSSVAIFGLAGFKLVPALTTVQGQLTLVQSTLPYTETVMRDIKDAAVLRENAEKLGKTPITNEPKLLELKDVEFTYPGAETPAVTKHQSQSAHRFVRGHRGTVRSRQIDPDRHLPRFVDPVEGQHDARRRAARGSAG